MLSAVFADTAGHIGGVGAVLEVVPAGRCQSGLKRRRPLLVGFSEPPNLVRRQAEVAKRLAEWLTIVNRIEELLPRVVRQPLVRSRPFPGSLSVAMCTAASCATTAGVPAPRCAVARVGHCINASGQRSSLSAHS
jgi:hypothetical protein